ncbi:MAG: NAD(P)H-dependent glycerol-3-phosphate dehydrogenase [Pseudomonadota bacterium]
MQKISIIGGGAWGTALAQVLANAGRDVMIWAREPEVVSSVNEKNENELYLAGVKLNKNIKATDSLTEAAESDALLLCTPAQHIRATLQSLKADIAEGKPCIICAKGVEIESGYLLSEVMDEVVPGATYAILTGPTFASEIAVGLPSAVTIACADKDVGAEIVEALNNKILRTYLTEDVLGAQIGGAVKNVIAIACGVLHGKGLGESARAALVTRGLAEMSRLASAMGAKKETLMGMCGVGDMILTCSSMQSRNFSLGVALGEGKDTKEILADRLSVTEGVHTAKALEVMARNHAVEMPIAAAVHACVNEGEDVDAIIEKLMERPVKKEAA